MEEAKSTEAFDSVLKEIGEFGRYQKIRICILGIFCTFFCASTGNSLMLITYSAPHSCQLPSGQNLTELRRLLLIPGESCRMRNLSDVYWNETAKNFSVRHGDTTECLFGMEYPDYGRETVVTQFGLVCGRDAIGSLMLTISMVLAIPGNFLFQVLPDKIGRKRATFFCMAWFLTSGVASALMPSAIAFTIVRALHAMTMPSTYFLPLMWMFEFVGPKERTDLSVVLAAIYGIVEAIIALIAYLCYSWKTFLLIVTLPALPALFLWFFFDESPRWLITQGKHEEAHQIMKKIVKENGTQLPQRDFSMQNFAQTETDMGKLGSAEVEKVSFLELFRHLKLFVILVVISYMTMVVAVVYGGLNLSSGSIGANPYLILGLLSLVETPAGFFIYTIEKMGRIWPNALSMGFAGLFSLASVLVAQEVASIAFMVAAKFCITVAICTAYQTGSELFPTVVRSSGQAAAGIASGLVAIGVPFLVYSSRLISFLPALVFGTLGLSGGILFLFLPEPIGTHLPNTIQDCERRHGFGLAAFQDNIRLRTVRKHWKRLKSVSTPETEIIGKF